jgi:hypothetical protein
VLPDQSGRDVCVTDEFLPGGERFGAGVGNMTTNRFIGRERLPKTNLRTAYLIESRFVDEDSGLYVVFEDRSIAWPGLDGVEPFTVARHDFEHDGSEKGTPEEVMAHLRDVRWERLVWIPVEVAHGDVGRFTIRYAHELQHYRQLLGAESLQKARNFLAERRLKGITPTIATEKTPAEFDADVVAFDTFESIHGPGALRDFIERESADPKMKYFHDRVLPLRDLFKAKYRGTSS